jgi:chitinase
VDFYRGTTLIGSDSSSPYSLSWTNVPAGSYSLKAVARDNAGATTVSSTRDITVIPPDLPTTAVFAPSTDHSTAVDRYVLEVFPAGTDTRVANPVATRDLGKPSVSNGECRVDIASTILGLAPGTYVATVTAFGDGGGSQSSASPQFRR